MVLVSVEEKPEAKEKKEKTQEEVGICSCITLSILQLRTGLN